MRWITSNQSTSVKPHYVPSAEGFGPTGAPDSSKVTEQIHIDYQVPIVNSSGEDASSSSQSMSPSFRRSLLPGDSYVAHFTTSPGPDSTLESGTIYIGAHLGEDERILWFQEKLKLGSDLMISDLLKAPDAKWDVRARIGSLFAVASIRKDTVPLWIGTCQVDIYSLGDDLQGQKGVAIKALHWVGDECWSWKGRGIGGQQPPDALKGWTGLTSPLTLPTGSLTLEDENEEANEGASLDSRGQRSYQTDNDTDSFDGLAAEQRVPLTNEIDDAFQQAFLFAMHQAKISKAGNLDFPIEPSFLISNVIQPYLRSRGQHYTIKKTSWKNTKRFIKHLDKMGLVKSKDRNGGETIILTVNLDHQQVIGFRPYSLPLVRAATGSGVENDKESASGNTLSFMEQKVTIQLVYHVSPKLIPTLFPSETGFCSSNQIRAALDSLEEQGASIIKVNHFLANTILASNSTQPQDDGQAIVTRYISRSALEQRLLDDAELCQPYHIILRDKEPSEQTPRAGSPPRIQIKLGRQRSKRGNRSVTKVSNLESYFMDLKSLASGIQKKYGMSATLRRASDSKSGLIELIFKGYQQRILSWVILPSLGIDAKWVNVEGREIYSRSSNAVIVGPTN
ncbi:hypothetical protein BGZ63DRAFT_471269 [Mariannaea sp. PMI_226]|nr:hypothetical protein BGZ63DRAFT_471269 [Mariannaea sp. PMI_226]